jgi:hypothetical protein
VLAESLAQMHREGIEGRIYNHPSEITVMAPDRSWSLGSPGGVPGRGDVLLIPSMWHSIEALRRDTGAEWDGQKVRIALEEDAAMTAEGRMEWILRRQERFHLVR